MSVGDPAAKRQLPFGSNTLSSSVVLSTSVNYLKSRLNVALKFDADCFLLRCALIPILLKLFLIVIIIIMVIFKCYFSGELIALS